MKRNTIIALIFGLIVASTVIFFFLGQGMSNKARELRAAEVQAETKGEK